MRVLPGFTKEAIRDHAKASIAPGSRVLSDGLSCFNGLAEADLRHIVKITGSGRPEGSDFKYAALLRSATCAPLSYLAAFEWRYNRRFELKENLCRLTRAAATITPLPRRAIIEIRPNPAD
jgi:hypothetical protein